MCTTYLIRHAEPVVGSDGRPTADAPLSEKGRRDAANLVKRLGDVEIEAIYSSPFRRARETVRPLAQSRDLQICEVLDLRERTLGHGPFEESNFEAAVRATWNDFSFAEPGGESNGTAQNRAMAALRELQSLRITGAIVICTHATLLALILHHLDRSVGFEFWRGISMPDVYRLDLDQTGVSRIRC